MTALLAASLSAPVPKEKPPQPHFPIVVGTKRVLESSINGEKQGEVTEEVTKVEEKDGVYTVTMEWPAFARTATGTFEVSGKKVRRMGAGNLGDYTMLDLGLSAGETWTREIESNGRKRVTTFTLGKEEEVEVPAGKFKAIPVTEQTGQRGAKVTNWYAPGVGLVKESSDSTAAKMVKVLKEFTPGKDAKK